ncbi:putative wd40 repeat-like protein [Golovinomyces cichoracearum]|uniref:Putative wd40 repeat-like protein n=1 Tax=Golovinomyces cichoracearum TaxID=62708 RepID=A0A420IFW2_9PEZI|nr:putative wd40 repeat-like protein [Golovinomyces cichoracearum]
MSSYSEASPGKNNSDNVIGMDTLLDQLRQQNRPVSLESNQRYFFNYNDYYGQLQPQQTSRDYLPPSVPTPPYGSSSNRDSLQNLTSESSQPRASSGTINTDRTSSLLNLLKFSQTPSASINTNQQVQTSQNLPNSQESSSSYPSSDGRNQKENSHDQAETNLLATLINASKPKLVQPSSSQLIKSSSARPGFSNISSSPSADTQAYLLQLLNQSKSTLIPENSKAPPLKQEFKIPTPQSRSSNHADNEENSARSPVEVPQDSSTADVVEEKLPANISNDTVKPKSTTQNPSGIFTYVNPFEGLAASSPRNLKQNSDKSIIPSSSTVQILKNPRNDVLDDKKMPGSEGSSSIYIEHKISATSKELSRSKESNTEENNQDKILSTDDKPKEKSAVENPLKEDSEQMHEVSTTPNSFVKKENDQIQAEQKHHEIIKSEKEPEPKVPFNHTTPREVTKSEKELSKSGQKNPLDSKGSNKKSLKDSGFNHVADNWENMDAEESSAKDEEQVSVKVYNFPMRPWTSIVIKESEEQRAAFRGESIMDIARLKREFDQLDRTQVTASTNFIVYAMSRSGGIRTIRQENGTDARIFNTTHDRIFNVLISTSPTEKDEAIIATGISGTVYWVQIKDSEGDHIEENHPETYGFALPPLPGQESDSTSEALKTRARKSSNHPDFFAIARGKFIYIILPSVIIEDNILKAGYERQVDVNNYLTHHSIKINTTKAGKDFTFSEDDTTIVSLDKTGRIKFWDVSFLTRRDTLKTSTDLKPTEIKLPITTFTSTSSNEKLWPTSILFVDKIRPYQRGGALRYFIVGMKQNHTLQLWDIALAKPVQEIHLPHTNDADPICSIVYHANTGMIVIGHPTRNSIYFLHLSAPKYCLPRSITQAEYLEKLASGDPSITKPDSTAVISGMREYSFPNKGNLRSLDILTTPSSANSSDSNSLFELYCMHSQGVTCLDIRLADLGWNSENKVVNPINAHNLNLISIDTLKEIPNDASESTAQTKMPTRIVPRSSGKEIEIPKTNSITRGTNEESNKPSSVKIDDKIERKDHSFSNSNALPPNAPEKIENKKRRKGPFENPGSYQSNSHFKMPVIDPTTNNRNINPIRNNPNSNPDILNQSSANDSNLKNLERLFSSSLDKLLLDFRAERQAYSTNSSTYQESMLKMVSNTLNESVEATLPKIVKKSIENNVLPIISDITSSVIQDQISMNLGAQIANQLPRHLQIILPDAISKALHQPSLLKLISDSISTNITFGLQEDLHALMSNNIIPTISNMLAQNTHNLSAEIQSRSTEQINILEQHLRSDSIKISQLTQLVTNLSETVSSMAAEQTEFQGQFLKTQAAHNRRNLNISNESFINHQTTRPSTPLTLHAKKSASEEEYDNMLSRISAAMNAGEYENAVIQWLQTRREQEFFVNYFSKFSHEFVRGLSPLLLLSLGATISVEFEGDINNDYINQRIAWLETILTTFQAHITDGNLDDQVQGISPKIMGIYCQRLEHLFMRISQISAHEPILQRISALVSAANRIVETVRSDERVRDFAGELGGGTPMGNGRHGM